ncbi:hypothetical protein ACQ4PT_022736 [Festuca glaucescens]
MAAAPSPWASSISPGVSTKRYLGIWFSVSNDTVYWVANRDNPLDDRSGMLVFNDAGSLVLLDGSRRTVWFSDLSVGASAVAAQLLESGNLVVRNGSSDAYLWQTFDSPSDTLLPGMKLGKYSWSRTVWKLTSWRSADDPSPGDYSRTLEGAGMPELVLWQGNVKTYRTGPWNGVYFNGVPEATGYSKWYRLYVTGSGTDTTYGYTALPGAPLTRVVVNHTGVAQRLLMLNKYCLLASIADDPESGGGKSFPIALEVAPVASAVTVLLVVFLIWWRMRRRILGAIPQNPSIAVHSVNLATLKHVTGNFSESNIIGQGGFGVVYKAQLADGRMIAVKRLKQSALTRKGKKDFAREVEVMAGLRHGSLLRLLAYCNQGKERILVYEYMQNKSLNIYIFGTPEIRASLNWARRLEIIHGIAHGVAYLHGGSDKSVIHRDLKPGNILLDDEWKAKVADFGERVGGGVEEAEDIAESRPSDHGGAAREADGDAGSGGCAGPLAESGPGEQDGWAGERVGGRAEEVEDDGGAARGAAGDAGSGGCVGPLAESGSSWHGRARLIFVGSGEAGPWVSDAAFLDGTLAGGGQGSRRAPRRHPCCSQAAVYGQ